MAMVSAAEQGGAFHFLDTTMRDGDQAQPIEHQFPSGTKPDAACEIAQMGVHTIEAGFPTTPKDAEEVKAVANTVGRGIFLIEPHSLVDGMAQPGTPYYHTPIITGLSRATKSDIDNTWDAVKDAHRPGIHTFIATDPRHVAIKFPGKTETDIVDMARAAVAHAQDVSNRTARIEFTAEIATSTPRDCLERVIKTVLDQGVDVINLPDTLGCSSPRKIHRLFSDVTRWVIEAGLESEVTISTHCHNDFGMATANTITAVQAVIETAQELERRVPNVQAEVVVGGRGERAGNASAEQVMAASLFHADEFAGLRMPEIDITRIAGATERIFRLLGMSVPPTAPIIGIDTRTHRSGIHSSAILRGGARIYTPFNPRAFGHPEAAIIGPGNYQGTAGNNQLGPHDVF